MLGIDFAVWLGLILSLASAVLCVGYGVIRWNAHDDSDSEQVRAPGPSAREMRKGRQDP